MKFLLDECAASRPLLTTLADLGHDVLSARDRFPHASDEALLALAREEFLLDECAASRPLLTTLADLGHDDE